MSQERTLHRDTNIIASEGLSGDHGGSPIEAKMRQMGVTRYRRVKDKGTERANETRSPGNRQVMESTIDIMARALREALKIRPNRSGGVGLIAHPLLRLLSPEKAALITCRTLFNSLRSAKAPVTTVAVKIASRIEDEIRFATFRKEAPGPFAQILKKVNRSSGDYRYQQRVLTHTHRNEKRSLSWEFWSTATKVHVGTRLLNVLIESTGAFEVVYERRVRSSRNVRTQKMLVPTAATLLLVADRDSLLEELRPWFLPTTEVPKDWVAIDRGGYHTYECLLVKDRGASYVEKMRRAQMPIVYQAVNTLQHTAWAVNEEVYQVLDILWESGATFKGMPTRLKMSDVPVRPAHIPRDIAIKDMPEHAKAEMMAWKKAKAEGMAKDARRSSKIIATRQTLDVAGMFIKDEQFYFPYQLDFRGRAYPIPMALQPQGPDVSRGLLRFADGKPVGEYGGEWLAIHGANCWGENKLPYDQRIEWVLAHAEDIVATAADPLTNRWWTKAEHPCQFLAFAFEWAEFLESDMDDDFVSFLPIGLDGSCNGLQHFAAILRDSALGEAVNLTNTETPEDIYQRVADGVSLRCKQDVRLYPCDGLDAEASSLAKQWLDSGLLGRGAVKRQVMTIPYGVTMPGMRQQLLKHLEDIEEERGAGYKLPFESVWLACCYLTTHLLAAIDVEVSSANKVMLYLKDCAGKLANKGESLVWTTPSGFPVLQKYTKETTRDIITILSGRTKLRIREATAEVDKRRQVMSVSPNFVHSLDAAHLMLTVAELPDCAFAMVHDSYGTHAADTQQLSETLREVFVRMYEEHDVLAEFRAETKMGKGVDLPHPPTRGDFDVARVRDAEFFFS